MVFRIAIQKHVLIIDCNSIVSNVMVHPTILHHATVLKRKSEESIKKELALNLLKDLLTIFIRVTLFPSPMINNKRTRFIKIG